MLNDRGARISDNSIAGRRKYIKNMLNDRGVKSNLLIKASQVNDIVKKYCDQNKWGYINHKAINATCLNSKGLHLNKKGTAIIAKSISSYIINH